MCRIYASSHGCRLQAGGERLYFSNPAHTIALPDPPGCDAQCARQNLTLRASDDAGVTWRVVANPHRGPSGYSSLVVTTRHVLRGAGGEPRYQMETRVLLQDIPSGRPVQNQLGTSSRDLELHSEQTVKEGTICVLLLGTPHQREKRPLSCEWITGILDSTVRKPRKQRHAS